MHTFLKGSLQNIKFILFTIIFAYALNISTLAKNDIQIVFPSDMEALTSSNIEFKWVPLKEEDVIYKITITRIVDTGMTVKDYPMLENAPKTYFKKRFKIFKETVQSNTFKIEDITKLFADRSEKEKKPVDKNSMEIGNMPEAPLEFYAWQVEAYKKDKLITTSSISIFIWNSMIEAPEPFIVKLIEPKDGDIVNPDNVKFCWESGEKGIQYHLNYIYELKDTNYYSMQGGPFYYLTLTQEKKTLDSLIFTIDSVEIGFFEAFSKRIDENAGNIKTLSDKFSTLKSKIIKRAKSSGISLDETSCELPDSCDSEPICDKLKSNDYLHRDIFKNRYKCLLDKIQLQNYKIQNLLTTHSKLQGTWLTELNRSTDFGIYDNFISFINAICNGKLNEIEKDALPEAYSIINCLNKIQIQLSELTKCSEYAKNCINELETESNNYKNDLIKHDNAVKQMWLNDSIKIESDIGLAVWDAIGQLKAKPSNCMSDTGVINFVFPPYEDINTCYSTFYTTLSNYLNNKICYLNIIITYDNKSNNASWSWTGPEKLRIPNCHQKFEMKETIASIEDIGYGKTICFPTNESERSQIKKIFSLYPNGKWAVEAEKSNSFITTSPRRDIFTKSLDQKKYEIKNEEKKNPVKSCNCIMRLLLNRVGVPPLNQKRGVDIGIPA